MSVERFRQCAEAALMAAMVVLRAPVHAQPVGLASKYAELITQEEMRRDLEVLASDAYEGRDTGKPGQKMAAAYIRERFMEFGIPPIPTQYAANIVDGYFQPFGLIEERSGSLTVVTKEGERLEFMKDIMYFSEPLKEDLTIGSMIYGGDRDRRIGRKARGKALAIPGADADLLTLLADARKRAEKATDEGVSVLFVFTGRLSELVDKMGHYARSSRMRLEAPIKDGRNAGTQVLLVDSNAVQRVCGGLTFSRLKRMRPGRGVRCPCTIESRPRQQRLLSENVLAYIEGTDKKDELVVITAHYDHIGVENGEVYNGADDDGSGTVAIMAMAKAFAAARADGAGPRRSILVMPVSGEEKGLLGSRYYTEHPVFPLDRTIANINIDMIGRVDSAHKGSPPYVYVIGSDRLSSDLHRVNEEVNTAHVGLVLDYTFNAPDDPNRFYYRSDHYNFARKGVPAIFYFSGVHEDYHGPGDEVDKIRFDLLHQRALLAFHTAWELANREERIRVDRKE